MRVLALIASLGFAAATVELDEKSWAGAVEGKNAFVKFLAPWSVLIADVDCTASGKQLCETHQVRGFPSIKVFKKDGKKSGEDYQGGRDFSSLKRYVDANLAGPECSLADKDGCTKDELKVLEESEGMSTADRRAKVQEMEASIKEKQKEAKALEKEAKELAKRLELIKLGGEKPDRVVQLLGDAEFREHCEHRTCVLAFLPHILDGGAAVRNDALKVLDKIFKKSKSESTPAGFMWLQGGDQFDIEEKLSLQFGFPAVIAINLKKERYGVHRGTFDEGSLNEFLKSMMIGKVPLSPVPASLPKFLKSEPWDGKDGELPQEEEL